MTGAGLEAVTEKVDELLLGFGSAGDELKATEPVLLMMVPFGTAQFSAATSVTFAMPPPGNWEKATLRLLPDPPQTPPPVEAQDTNVVFAGRLSVTVTLEAALGFWL